MSHHGSLCLVVKKLEPPRFCVNVREYPTFVKDFERLMVSQHGKDPYVLRQSLSGKALDIVGGLMNMMKCGSDWRTGLDAPPN